MRKKIVLLDLYSTLLHSPFYYSVYTPLLNASINSLKTWNFILTYKREMRHLFEDLEQRNLLLQDVNQSTFYEKLNNIDSYINMYYGSISTIQSLQSRDYKVGIIGDVPRPYTQPLCTRDLYQYSDLELFPCDIGMTYESPEAFYEVAQRMGGWPDDTLLVGDREAIDKTAAQKMQINTLEIDRKNSAVGRKTLLDLSELLERI
ncbi:MAG TPA: HAD family hydrolase [bacterium]|nr:HAD family hydrolase [bacterium]